MSPTFAPETSRHLLDADDERQPRLAGGDRVQPLMDRRRAGGAGVLDPRRRLEAKAGIGLEHERGRKLLADKPAVHRAEIDRVDIGRRDPGIGQGGLRDLDDQLLDVFAFVLAEFAVRPADDAPAHDRALLKCQPHTATGRNGTPAATVLC